MVSTLIPARSGQALIPSLCDAPLTLKLITRKLRPSINPLLRAVGGILPKRRPRHFGSAQEDGRKGKLPAEGREREERPLKIAVLTSGGVAPGMTAAVR